MILHSVPLEEILLDGPHFDDFIFTYPIRPNDLIASINKTGLLQPVCLRAFSDRWQIVFGARRILACKQLGWQKISARILTEQECSPYQALEMSLEEDLAQRVYNPIEIARVFERFQTIGKLEFAELAGDLAARMGFPRSREMVRNYLLLLQLEEEIKLAVALGDMQVSHAVLLAGLRSADRGTIFKAVFEKCAPTLSEGREIIDNLMDLKIIAKKSISALLDEKPFADILNSPSKNPREKCRLLRADLRKRRYPQLQSLEQSFSNQLENLALDKRITVRPANYFEENHLNISFRAQNLEDLRQAVQSLQTAANGGIERLFEIVKKGA